MKKLLVALLTLLLVFSLAGCDLLPEEVRGPVDNIIGIITGTHVHDYVVFKSESKAATCLEDGIEVKYCDCGAREENVVPALGHKIKVIAEVKADCLNGGYKDYMCLTCDERFHDDYEALGHNMEEKPSEPSRVMRCLNEGCTVCLWGESGTKHKEALTFNFDAEDEAAINAKYDEVLALINAADKYNSGLHGYAEEGELADAFAIVDGLHTELYEMILDAISQRQLAEIEYYCDMDNAELEERYTYMMDYYTAVIAKFYTLSRPFYDSCYREFYYYGMTDEEINSFLFDSDALSNEEYTKLKNRNDAIEAEIVALSEKELQSGDKVPLLYAEFVANNNKMAEILGYNNYLEYAYENVYSRDYTYQEVAKLSDYFKTYIAPAFDHVYDRFDRLTGYTQEDLDEYRSQVANPFFEDLAGNTTVNDYIDLLAFTSNPDKQITFSDEFNKLCGDGNLFRGDYDGAFVTTITSVNLPIAYFGPGYDDPFTIVHEFGHFMNEVYNEGEYDQSYDLLEMHSQGDELLYLAFLEEQMTEMAYTLVETQQLVNMLYVVMAGVTVDNFEQAIYLNEYDGKNADIIMEDGAITYDEYDLLYSSICADYGVTTEALLAGYWRYGMTITSPCYYISYSVSAISVLQLYEMAGTEGFDAAKDAYLKLFTYTDENPELDTEGVLLYAGLYSFNDEQLYKELAEALGKV